MSIKYIAQHLGHYKSLVNIYAVVMMKFDHS